MVTTSGFAGTPVTRALILGLTSTSLLTSILDIKHLAPINPTPHLWPYLQLSRLLTFQLAYISSTELLFAVALLYQCRVLERLWGARRYASFVLATWMLSGGLVIGVGVVLKVLTFGWWSYIPPGITGLVVSVVAVWKDETPELYSVRVATGLRKDTRRGNTSGDEQDRDRGSGGNNSNEEPGVVFSDKFVTYLMAAQLTLSQFPYQLLPAIVGWVIGVAWREELLPTNVTRWRVPAWLVGETGAAKGRGQYEGLRRRLEEEGSAQDGMREVSDRVAQSQQTQRRGIGQRMMGYFTGS